MTRLIFSEHHLYATMISMLRYVVNVNLMIQSFSNINVSSNLNVRISKGTDIKLLAPELFFFKF